MAQLESLTPEIVGRRYPVLKFQITETWVRDYKEALGYPEDLSADSNFVPPLFLACLRDAEFYVFEALGIRLSQLLHASQRYEFIVPVKVGDNIVAETEVASLRRKDGKNGAMIFLEVANHFDRVDDKGKTLMARAYMTVVVRSAPQ